MANISYLDMMDQVAQYYGSGSDAWSTIASQGVTAETLPIIEQVPGVSVTLSNSGNVLGYDYTYPFQAAPNPASIIDSNVQTGLYGQGAFQAPVPATATEIIDVETKTVMESGAKVASSGATLATIADRASLAIMGVSLGMKLGKAFDEAVYNADPEWFDENWPTFNPQTWDSIATTEGGKAVVRALFGIEQESATMYLDERLLAYTYMVLNQQGAWSGGGYDVDQSSVDRSYLSYPDTPYTIYPAKTITGIGSQGQLYEFKLDGDGFLFITQPQQNLAQVYGCSNNPNVKIENYLNGSLFSTNTLSSINNNGSGGYGGLSSYRFTLNSGSIAVSTPSTSTSNQRDIARIILHSAYETPTIDGVTTDSEATTQIDPALITGTTVDDVLTQLKQNYPQLFDGAIYEDVPQADGSLKRVTYIPTPYPDTTNINRPVTGANHQNNPQVTPQTNTESLLQQLTDMLTGTGQPPATGDGTSPTIIPPTGTAASLWKVYNPTQAQVDSFGAWLWSSDFIEQIKKLFNDPMQAIIGIHKVFAAPAIGGTATIKCGYIDSGVSSNYISNQYAYVDCGTVDLSEYFGNVFDYGPYTDVNLYLPFIGIVSLNVADVMRSQINVKYSVDVISGACLAEVRVMRDGAGGTLYQYAGDCAVRYPISSGSYMGLVSGILGVAGGIVSGVMSGGAALPLAAGAVLSGISHAKTNVQHSGGFSGNAGAMGAKKPYLIIERPQSAVAEGYGPYQGIGANQIKTVGEMTGFFKMSDVRTDNIEGASADEIDAIRALLSQGVIK